MVILIGQYSNCNSLRDIVETINFHKVEHYHLGLKNNICRSTLSEANSKRDWRIFKDLFLYLISDMKNKELIETKDIVTLIDSTPIRINEDWCEKTLIRIKGLKVHTVYNLNNNIPVYFDITGAKTEDITEAKKIINEDNTIKENYTYVFDRGYISSEWWNKINKLKAFFITRNFKHYSYKLLETKYIHQSYCYCSNSNSDSNNNNNNNDKNNKKNTLKINNISHPA